MTTGVSFTAYAAVRTLERVASLLEEDLAGKSIAVAGFPGALAGVIADLLASRKVQLSLVGEGNRALAKAAARFEAEVATDPAATVAAADYVIGASSTGGALEAAWLSPGAVVIDVAEPRDLPRRVARPDVLVVDGENVSLPADVGQALGGLTRIYNWLVGQRRGTIYACFAEPMVLALERRAEAFSLGKAIVPEKVEEIGRLGEQHGFAVKALLHAGREISSARLARIRLLRKGARILERRATSA